MGAFKLEKVSESEFPTLGRVFADEILDEFLNQLEVTVRVRTYSSSWEEIFIANHLLRTVKQRIEERRLNVQAAIRHPYLYLRKV